MVTVIPAVDMLGGKCVRLRQGDPARPTMEQGSPAAVAFDFARQGARRLHIINLGAALDRAEHEAGLDVLRTVTAGCAVPVQYGGGLRSLADLAAAVEAGATWVITGTAALGLPGFLAEAAAEFGDRLVLALDLRDGRPMVRGWQEAAPLSAAEALDRARQAGVRRIMITDAGADGTLGGLRSETFAPFLGQGLDVIAAGGVAGLADIGALSAQGAGRGLSGIVAGSALLRGHFSLADAQSTASAAAAGAAAGARNQGGWAGALR